MIGHDPGVHGPSRAQLRRFVDVAIPVAVGIMLVLVVLGEGRREGFPWTGLGIVLALVQGVALRWRRSHPELVMAIALAGGLGMWLLAPDGLIPYAGLFALGSLAAARPPRVSLPALAALIGLSALNFFTAPVGDTLFVIVLVIAAWALGEVLRNRRVAIEEAASRAVAEEQARIARDLHDVIAHSVSVIVVQAGAAEHVFATRPDQARAALRSIEAAGRDALRELRRLLAGVRPDVDDEPHPPIGLERVDELAEPLRAAGLEVAVRREGPPLTLPPSLDLTAYRIVQEALTNTLRHARATRAEVTVRYLSDALEVDVRDNGRADGGAGDGSGFGVRGMRERAAMLGGTLEAGPATEGGYRVHARLPLEERP